MKRLFATYGLTLTAIFTICVLAWSVFLIFLPQFSILERALVQPKRQLDSSIAATLALDAGTCISVLETQQDAETNDKNQSSGGLSIPSMGAMTAPSLMRAQTGRPYILQCDRATTLQAVVRRDETLLLADLYNLPKLKIETEAEIGSQIETARQIQTIARELEVRLKDAEAKANPYTWDNFQSLMTARNLPILPETLAAENAKFSNQVYSFLGLRYIEEDQVYVRIGLITLVRTLGFAAASTVLALFICYPIAYKIALATKPDRILWMMLILVIPYAIVELMRIYAWTTIIDNRGLLNSALDWIGAIDLDDGEAIQFKRSPLTVFIVLVYTYVLFLVFPMLNVMSTLDKNQIDAARDLGAGTIRIHRRIIIPHAKPGIVVGAIATFMLSAGAFSVPRIVSRGLQAEWFSQTIYNKFFESENSNVGAAYTIAFTIACFVLVAIVMWMTRTRLRDFVKVQS
jgi:spermidine/putrescine transport system permease protein